MHMHTRIFSGLAAGLLCGSGAMAQSNVTIYGRLDLGLRWTGNANAAGASMKSLDSGSTSGSRFGLKGSEDLGDGLKALFTLEQGINPDTGTLAQSGRGWGRQSWVALQNNVGTLTAGRQYSPIYVIEATNEPFGPYNLYEPGFIYDNYTGGNRWDNAIKLESLFSGVSLAAMVSAGEGSTGRKQGVSAGYASGPFTINGAWQQTALTSGAKQHKAWTLGGTWNVAPVKLYLSYLDHKSDTTTQTNKAWAVGASYAVMPLLDLVAGYYRDAQRNADGKKQELALMANYKLSKRSNVYVQADRGTLSGGYASNVFDAYAWPTGITSRTTATVGLRHMF